jgi:hypothetical protein
MPPAEHALRMERLKAITRANSAHPPGGRDRAAGLDQDRDD